MKAEEIFQRSIDSNDHLLMAEQVKIMEQLVSQLHEYINQLKANNWQVFLEPGCEVVSITSGFSGPAGIRCKFLGFIAKGTLAKDGRSHYGDDYLAFGYDPDNPLWLVEPHKWHERVKRVS